MSEPLQTSSQPTAPQEDLLCPLCEYNLRGLPEARCPECGYRTTWEELRNRPPLHPYLFEHHPKRNIVSFSRTVLGTLLPRRFWRGVSPTMQLRPKRLAVFAIVVMLLATMGVMLGATGEVIDQSRVFASIRTQMARHIQVELNPANPYYDAERAQKIQQGLQNAGSVDAWLRQRYPKITDWLFWQMLGDQLKSQNRPWRQLPLHRPAMLALLWGPLTFASLMIFRVSMRQARIKPVHVWRCIIYSGAILSLLGPYLLIATPLIVWGWNPYGQYSMLGYIDNIYIACAIILGLLVYRLAVAYRVYLHFRRAVLVILASQVIVALVLLKLDMWMIGH